LGKTKIEWAEKMSISRHLQPPFLGLAMALPDTAKNQRVKRNWIEFINSVFLLGDSQAKAFMEIKGSSNVSKSVQE
jgi:hypothetical protein